MKRSWMLLVALVLLSAGALAASDPGHDTLYIEATGDSALEGKLNISEDLKVANLFYSTYLHMQANGSAPPTSATKPNIYSLDNSYLYVNAPVALYLLKDAGSTVYVGGSNVHLNVSGDTYVTGSVYSGGKLVCLADGTNCVGGNNTGNVSSVTASTGLVNTGTSSDPVLAINASYTQRRVSGTCAAGTSIASINEDGTVSCETDDAGTPDGTGGWTNDSTLVSLVDATDNVTIDTVHFDNTNNRVGIGTAAPRTPLEVNGSIASATASPSFVFEETDVAADDQHWIMDAVNGNLQFLAADETLTVPAYWLIVNRTGTTIDQVLFPNGNVGIGTAAPSSTLHVVGTANVSGALYANGSTVCTAANGLCGGSGGDGTGGWTNTSSTTSTSLNVSVGSGTLFVDATNNRVGIGTTAPRALLHVTKDQAAMTELRVENSNISDGAATGLTFYNNNNLRSYLNYSVNAASLTLATAHQSGHLNIRTGDKMLAAYFGTRVGVALTGTVTVTSGTTTVIGTGTTFTTEIEVGEAIRIGQEIFTVAAIANDTNLTLDSVHVAGAAGSTAYRDDSPLFSVVNGDADTKLTIKRTGNMGVGEVGPLADLHITNDQDNVTELRIDNTDVTSNAGTALTLYDGSVKKALFEYDNSADTLTIGTTAASGEISIVSGSGVMAMTIDNTRYVGIGSASPRSQLTIYGNSTDRGTVSIENEDTDVQAAETIGIINFRSNEDSVTNPPADDIVARIHAVASSQHTGSSWPTDIVFSTVNGSNTLTEYMRIKAGGNVGINMSTPSSTLHVVGTANVSGAVYLPNSACTGSQVLTASSSGLLSCTSVSATEADTLASVLGRGAVASTGIDMNGTNLITNIGNAGTDFTSGGGLNVAGTLAVAGAGPHSAAGNFSFDAGTLFVDATNNRVGIGTTAPQAKLDLTSTSGVTLRVNDTVGGGGMQVYSSADSFPLQMFNSGTGAAILGIYTNEDGAGTIIINNATGYTKAVLESGTGANAGSLYLNNESGHVVLLLTAQKGANSYITNGGNVGIGTTAPQNTLDVHGKANINGTLILNGSASQYLVGSYGGFLGGGTVTVPGGSDVTAAHMNNVHFTENYPGLSSIPVIFDANGGILAAWNDPDAIFLYADSHLVVNGTSGNVGIGTTAPAVPLDIDSNSNAAGLRLRGAQESAEMTDMYVQSTGSFIIDNTVGSDMQGYIDLRPEDDEYGLMLRESDGTGQAAYANFYVVDSTTDYMNIVVKNVQSTPGLVITEDELVGIGTTAPSRTFEVKSASGAGVQAAFYRPSNTAGTNAGIEFALNNASDERTVYADMLVIINDTTAASEDGVMAFRTKKAGTMTEHVRITQDGNVGIGTSSPQQALDVVGAGNFTGGAYIGDASGDTFTVSASAVSIPNSLSFDSGVLKIDATANWVSISDVGSAYTPTGVLTLRSANPNITFVGSSSTAMITGYQSGTGNMVLQTNFASGDIIFNTAGANARMTINEAGSVRIGTGTPGNATGAGDLYVTSDIEYDGVLYAPGADVAERFSASDDGLAPGTVVELDPQGARSVRKSASPYSPLVAGVVSSDPATILGSDKDGPAVALAGQVPVRVNAENGPIAVGDYLVSSSTPGEAMGCRMRDVGGAETFGELKALLAENERCRNAAFAKAMEPMEENGMITGLVFLN